jgi:hypothetical protein
MLGAGPWVVARGQVGASGLPVSLSRAFVITGSGRRGFAKHCFAPSNPNTPPRL